MDKLPQPGVSVLMCCYNSASRLPQTLKYLTQQVVPAEINWEVIIIDNASTDNTSTTARFEWQQYYLPTVGFEVLNEPRPRKYHAISTGVDHARYECIIICDDDNWLNEFYVDRAFKAIQADKQIAAAGGRGIAVADEEIPDWFWQYQHNYAVGSQNNTSGDVSAKGYLWGAGMVFRRSIYKKVYRNSSAILLGPAGQESGRAEDVELCLRFLLAGYRLYYDEGLIFKHYLHGNRLTDKYKQGLLNVSPYENCVLNLYHKQIRINNLPALQKHMLLSMSFFRYLLCKLFPLIRRWNYSYEAEMIYLLSGLKPAPVSDEAIKIRQLNIHLSNKAFA